MFIAFSTFEKIGYVQSTIIYIQSHSKNLKTKSIAEYMGSSLEYLMRQFKQKTGLTIKKHIVKQNMDRAAFLLKYTNESILFISVNLNYCSHSHFTHLFLLYFAVHLCNIVNTIILNKSKINDAYLLISLYFKKESNAYVY